MILGIYVKNRKKDKWSLFTVVKDLEIAKKTSKKLIKEFQEIGYDDADAIIQKFTNMYDIPGTLDKIKNETELYN
jgi:hypothetical protein